MYNLSLQLIVFELTFLFFKRVAYYNLQVVPVRTSVTYTSERLFRKVDMLKLSKVILETVRYNVESVATLYSIPKVRMSISKMINFSVLRTMFI